MLATKRKKRILVAPINWGLGHATRCIPIIKALILNNYNPIIASDGYSLKLLQKEFPELESIELPSYNIRYSKSGHLLKLKLLVSTPRILRNIKLEKRTIAEIVKNLKIDGIISDNRFGAYHKNLPCVFITHQLKVLSGNTTWLSTKIHQNIIQKFQECWVPDILGKNNLSGRLGNIKTQKFRVKHIGPLSRFEKSTNTFTEYSYDLMVLISGPEPQRTLFENKLYRKLKEYNGSIIFIKGIVETQQNVSKVKNFTFYNYMTSKQLEKAIKQSNIIISRSGYTTIMDLTKLSKKAFFIPTPGQFEQRYLAKYLDEKGIVPSCSQGEFNVAQLKRINAYKGLKTLENKDVDYGRLFGLFEGK